MKKRQKEEETTMAKRQVEIIPKVRRDSQGVRDAVFDVLDKLRGGEMTPTMGNAQTRAAAVIIASQLADINTMRQLNMLGRMPPEVALSKPVVLGSGAAWKGNGH
jgi:hypothetical protein